MKDTEGENYVLFYLYGRSCLIHLWKIIWYPDSFIGLRYINAQPSVQTHKVNLCYSFDSVSLPSKAK